MYIKTFKIKIIILENMFLKHTQFFLYQSKHLIQKIIFKLHKFIYLKFTNY